MTQKLWYITEKGMERRGEEPKKKKNKENKGGWRNTTVERKEEP